MMRTTNLKYEITNIVHKKYPFLHRIRALRDIGDEVKKGDLGGFVESEDNLSFEPDDTSWIFHDAISCNNAYVEENSILKDSAIACDNAHISREAYLSGCARAEDDTIIRGAYLSDNSRASGTSIILCSPVTSARPMLWGSSVVYGKVTGAVQLSGNAVIAEREEISSDTLDTICYDGKKRRYVRAINRDKLFPLKKNAKLSYESEM